MGRGPLIVGLFALTVFQTVLLLLLLCCGMDY